MADFVSKTSEKGKATGFLLATVSTVFYARKKSRQAKSQAFLNFESLANEHKKMTHKSSSSTTTTAAAAAATTTTTNHTSNTQLPTTKTLQLLTKIIDKNLQQQQQPAAAVVAKTSQHRNQHKKYTKLHTNIFIPLFEQATWYLCN